MRAAFAMLLAVCVVQRARAHVGSPDTWFEGNAGPYPIRVVVRAPGVVPGLAEISVRVLGGHPTQVTAQPFAWNAGEHGAPPADVAQRVPGDPQLYSVSLWFMVTTSYGVHVHVSGAEGDGMAIVPVQAVPTRRLPLDGPLRTTLIALGLFLCVGLLTLVGAAAREGSLPPGTDAARSDRHRARIGVTVAGLVLVAALTGARSWWDNVDRAYASEMYRPFHIRTQVDQDAVTAVTGNLRLAIDDERWRGRRWSPLIPDHGKLMHLFLVRDGDMNAFAHLHPVMDDSSNFECTLPSLPAGLYRVYADIVHESGFAQTLSDSVRIRELATAPQAGTPAWVPTDADDSWFTAAAAAEASGDTKFTLADGATLVWERGTAALVERAEAPLHFRVLAPDGTPSRARAVPRHGRPRHPAQRRRRGVRAPAPDRQRGDGVADGARDAHGGRQRERFARPPHERAGGERHAHARHDARTRRPAGRVLDSVRLPAAGALPAVDPGQACGPRADGRIRPDGSARPRRRRSASLALATVVLQPVDAPALAILHAIHPHAFARRHHAVEPGAALHPLHATLARTQAPRLATRQLATAHALLDALMLTQLATVHARRDGTGAGSRCGQYGHGRHGK